ncbi:TIGR03118 family protein [Massilia agilis]|uniref:TIGR03118 family protein n=1 Tax=Massilia agilis TaxID=1811226 RepID=A0ABT2D5T8_9BURK|nr:TIGR03118 family protein [Massilia agilis]MCS0806522.1 TIGR03118 family protein [Massilia agilis]
MNIIHRRLALALGTCAVVAMTAGCATQGRYHQRNLVSDTAAIPAEHHDPQLVNAWGLAFNPFGVAWVADNGTGVSTLYDGNGNKQPLVVTIPPAPGNKTGNPTGIVFYGGPEFVVTHDRVSGPARFIFASEDGGISAWAPNVAPTTAIRVINNTGAIYKGLALSGNGGGPLLYATDFHNNKVDVYDGAFNPILLGPGAFRDPAIPSGYAPFGIQAIAGDIYVSYAKQDADAEDDVPGPGFGFVSVFDPQGHFVRRLISRGELNAPWGMALAPASFGHFGNRLLVGNFGNGIINAYDLDTGHWEGRLLDEHRRPIRIDGLWGIAFGNGVQQQPTNTLFFASGPQDEQHGLYGRIDVAPGEHGHD